MHLVLREVAPSHTSSTTATTTRGHSPAPAAIPSPAQRPAQPAPQLGPQPPSGFRRAPVQSTPSPFLSLGGGGQQLQEPATSTLPHHLPHQQPPTIPTTHQQMSSWLTQLQRESMNRNLAQGQRTRAGMGMRGIGDNSGQETNSGRASPAVGHYYRETIGPNGQMYQVETIIRGGPGAPSQANGGGLSPADVQSLLRSADLSQMASAMNGGVHRSASNSSLHNRFTNPGVTVPAYPTADSRVPSGRATPDPSVRSVSGGHQDAWGQPPPGRSGVDVYILSSPEGPRALLVNNTTSETYYSPRLRTQPSHPRLRNLANFTSPTSTGTENPMQQIRPEDTHQPPQHQAPEQQPQGQALNAEPVPVGEGLGHPHNPHPGLPPLLVRAAPHIWLLIRLGIFVWLFTTPNSSWSRWLSIIGLAIFVFVVNIGVLNNAAEGAWRPLLQQLQNMLPRLENQQAQQDEHQPRHQGRAGQEQGGEPGGNGREPNPADMAERLVARRQGWLQAQLRRVERASLLFLASLAPGVAEEHIANLENEARAERQRREAEAAEAARQAEAEAAGNSANAEGDANATGASSGPEAEASQRQEEQRNEGQPRANDPEPLIAF